MMRRIMHISEGVTHLRLQPRWITSFLICIILHILVGLIQSTNLTKCGIHDVYTHLDVFIPCQI